jgi:hypothetical protein
LVTIYSGQLFDNKKVAHIFGVLFPLLRFCFNFYKKICWVTFWAIFS